MWEGLAPHLEVITIAVGMIVFFYAWRKDQDARYEARKAMDEAFNEAQKTRDEALMVAIKELGEAIHKEGKQSTREHTMLKDEFVKLDQHTVEEHRNIAEALTALTTSLNHLIGEIRAHGAR